MNALFFDYQERRIADSGIIESFAQIKNADEDTLTVCGYGFPDSAEYVGFFNRRGKFVLYHIVDVKTDEITHAVTLYAENDIYELVTENPIRDIRPTNTTAGLALVQALNGTRFEAGVVEDTTLASTRWFYCSPFAAIRDIESCWPVRAEVRYQITGARITHRYIDLLSSVPVWRGKRFEIGKDVLTAMFEKDRRNVVTALVGRGKGESVGDGYGRRISFSDVVWSKANGDPADKPAGQDWIEDPEATALYGVCGTRPRFSVVEFDDIEDPEALLWATWETLQSSCEPVLYGEMSVADLETIGFPYEAAEYGDSIAFISNGRRARSTIVGITREYAFDGADVFQFGKLCESSSRQMATVKRDLATTQDKASAGAQIAQRNEGLLSGYIDTMKTKILSTGTKLYTDEHDGGIILETSDGLCAVKLTGSGILIASTKVSGAWKWTLAIDGGGIVADTITTGVLHAAAVKILGTDAFYWDAANICIINPDDTNQQIRFGLYDGTHYGIGFTVDGGQTWQNVIGFSGVTFSNGSVSLGALSEDAIKEINAYAKAVAEEQAEAAISAAEAAQAAAEAAQSNANAALDAADTAQNTAAAAQDAAAQAAADALEAAGLAGGKGKVWFQSTAPDGGENDLWIDTGNGANTPKRWNGEAWVAVTDKAATDAAAAAAAADQAAADAAAAAAAAEQTAAEAAETANAAGQVAVNAVAAAAAAQEAANNAQGDIDALGQIVTAVQQKITDESIIATVRESTEYKGDLNAMVKQTTFEQNARDVSAIFQRIGLDGGQTGIVKADIDGIKVTHSNFGGYTQQAADGFKMYDSTGNVIGGMFSVGGSVISAVQRLMNAARTEFYVEVAPGLYADEEDGLRFWYGNAVCGFLSGIYDSDGDGNGSMRLRANEYLYLGDKTGGLSFQQILNAVNRVHFNGLQPTSANEGDIWLCPIDD